MYISKINKSQFKAGKVTLYSFSSKNLKNFDAIKSLAIEKDIDISIYYLKAKSEFNNDKFITIAKREISSDNHTYKKKSIYGTALSSITSFLNKEEISDKIYSDVVKSIESFENNMSAFLRTTKFIKF